MKLFFIIFLTVTLIFPIFSNKTEYGTELEKISLKDTCARSVIIPLKDAVTILVLFNIDLQGHLSTLLKFNSLLSVYANRNAPVSLFAISIGDMEKFNKFQSHSHLKFSLIRDDEKKLFSMFEYACGECMKIIIFDKKGIIRFNATYVNYPIIKRIIERYINKGSNDQ